MREHPIQGLMKTAMESIKGMVDVNTVVGEPVETQDGSVIMPVSRVSFGFAAGGGEYLSRGRQRPHGEQKAQSEPRSQGERTAGEGEGSVPEYPFGGGSGAGVTVQPVAFLVVGQGTVRLLPVDSSAIYDRLIDLAPQILDRLRLPGGRSGSAGGIGFTGGASAPIAGAPTMGGPSMSGPVAGGSGGGNPVAGGSPAGEAPGGNAAAGGSPAAGAPGGNPVAGAPASPAPVTRGRVAGHLFRGTR